MSTEPDWHWHFNDLVSHCHCGGASELSPAEAWYVERFEAAEPAPESYVWQHRSEPDCWCGPIQVGTLGVWTHQMGDTQ